MGELMTEVRVIVAVVAEAERERRLGLIRRKWLDAVARGCANREEMMAGAGILLLVEQLVTVGSAPLVAMGSAEGERPLPEELRWPAEPR